MTTVKLSEKTILGLLLLYVVLITALQLWMGPRDRWAGYSVLTPLVAAALLPFRRTLLVGAITLLAIIGSYGYWVTGLSVGGRFVIIMATALSFGISLIVCRVRLEREERVRRLMVARDRLSLLSAASSRVGSTLDVRRTARELAEVASSRFADSVTVDLFETVLRGEEPQDCPVDGLVTLRRVAHSTATDADERASGEPATASTEARKGQEVHVPARWLGAGRPTRSHILVGDGITESGLTVPLPSAGAGAVGRASAIAVPLSSGEAFLGLAVFARGPGTVPFDTDDLMLAEEIAMRAAVCVDNARRYTRERETSLTLQRSLLPDQPPQQPAVDAAARYVPADSQVGVGGDWFDVIPLSGARVALVVGDVVGHGLQASATMGRLRSAVRTLADIDLPPDELLTHLDDIVIKLSAESSGDHEAAQQGDIGATCLYAVYDPVSRDCTLASAGHPAPALATPDGACEFIDLSPGPPLGLGGLPFESVTLSLPEGSLIALYSDGLVESRHRDVDAGSKELKRLLAQHTGSLEETCGIVLKALVDEPPQDDVALLLAGTRALDASQSAAWEFASDPAVVSQARDAASRQLNHWGLEDAVLTTELVVSELVTNAIRYGTGRVQLRLIRQKTLICEVSDGSNTAPHLRRARTFEEGGRGLFIIANITERWGTRQGRRGKTIWAEQVLGSPAHQPATGP